jgi:uncharacterized protein (DUF1778 family)
MAKVKLTLEVAPELRRRIKIAAAMRDESLRQWVHRAVLRELEAEKSEAGQVVRDPDGRGVTESAAGMRT